MADAPINKTSKTEEEENSTDKMPEAEAADDVTQEDDDSDGWETDEDDESDDEVPPEILEQLSELAIAVSEGDLNKVKGLVKTTKNLENDADPRLCPVNLAYCKGDFKMFEFLVKNGLNLEVSGSERSLLTKCVTDDDEKAVKVLLEGGANVNSVDPENQFPPLFYAISKNNLSMVRLLLSYGADVLHETDSLFTVLDIACLPYDAPYDSWNFLVPEGEKYPDAEILATILEHKPDVDHVGESCYTALMHSTVGVQEKHVRLLVAAGASQSDISDERIEFKPLYIAHTNCLSSNVLTRVKSTIIFRTLLDGMEHEELSAAFYYAVDSGFISLYLDKFFKGKVFPLKRPTTRYPSLRYVTPLTKALRHNSTHIAEYLLSALFITKHDVQILRQLKNEKKLGESTGMSKENSELVDKLFSQPWALKTLSFVEVSEMMGYDSKRAERISASGLPGHVQSKLLFDKPPTQTGGDSVVVKEIHGLVKRQ